MANSLLIYDVVIKANTITFAVCDQFYEGAYVQDQKKIVICCNTMRDYQAFANAAQRQLIRMYD
jgi:hypothetical protein